MAPESDESAIPRSTVDVEVQIVRLKKQMLEEAMKTDEEVECIQSQVATLVVSSIRIHAQPSLKAATSFESPNTNSTPYVLDAFKAQFLREEVDRLNEELTKRNAPLVIDTC